MSGMPDLMAPFRSAITAASQGGGDNRSRARVIRSMARAQMPHLAAFGIDTDDDDELVAGALLASRGRLAGAGNFSGRWNQPDSEIGSMLEEYGLENDSIASGSTNADHTFAGTLDIDLDDAVLYLWDPTGHVINNAGYWSQIKVDKRTIVLGATEGYERKPCDADDLAQHVGEGAESRGGIFLGNLRTKQDYEIKVFVPSSTTDVPLGLVVRGTPAEEESGYRLLRGRGLRRRTRFFTGK